MNNKTLRRSATNQVIAGVCGGIGEYFEVDPTIIRILFIILGFATGSGILIYIILWLVIPGPTSAANTPSEATVKEGFREMETKFHEVKEKIEQEITEEERQTVTSSTQGPHWLGIALILIGGWFFLRNFGFFRFVDFGRLWPIAIILIGVYFLMNKKK